MDILQFIIKNFDTNWKAHYDAKLNPIKDASINIFNFNHDEYDVLRDKDSYIFIQDDYLVLEWCCQKEWDDDFELVGMKAEIKRWIKHCIHMYCRNNEPDIDVVKIKVKLWDRDGYKKKTFTISCSTK